MLSIPKIDLSFNNPVVRMFRVAILKEAVKYHRIEIAGLRKQVDDARNNVRYHIHRARIAEMELLQLGALTTEHSSNASEGKE